MKKSISLRNVIVIVILAVLLTFNTTYVVMNVHHNATVNEYLAENSYLDTLLTVDQIIRANYDGKIDDEELKNAVIRGYLEGIGDKYGQYMTASEYEAYKKEVNGSSVGIGVNVIYDAAQNSIEVIDVIPDSPAEKAQVLVGDHIVAVDGNRIDEVGYYGMVDLIKGESGTSVEITVLRDGEEIILSCARAEVSVITVEHHVYSGDDEIGVIRISSFYSETPAHVIAAVEDLKNKGCTKFIFDIRNNGGGELGSIVKTLDFILPEGKLVDIRYANGASSSERSNASFLDAPVAVLINGNTASAAELFAAALRDYTKEGKYNALLVGTKTYGKGVLQSFYELNDGSAFKFTAGHYDPPCGVNYDGIGITPDVIEDLSEEAKKIGFYRLTDETDNQLIFAAARLSAM